MRLPAFFLLSLLLPTAAFSCPPQITGCNKGEVLITEAIIHGCPIKKCVNVCAEKPRCDPAPAGCAYVAVAEDRNGCPMNCGTLQCGR